MYLFYPETAGRSLEDIDRFFAGHAPLLVFKDREAIAEKRPQRFVEHEREEVRRNSSIISQHVAAANAVNRNKEAKEFHEDV